MTTIEKVQYGFVEEFKERAKTNHILWQYFVQAHESLAEREEFVKGAEVMLREAAGLEPAEIEEELKDLKEEASALQREFEKRKKIWYRDYCERFVKKRKEHFSS